MPAAVAKGRTFRAHHERNSALIIRNPRGINSTRVISRRGLEAPEADPMDSPKPGAQRVRGAGRAERISVPPRAGWTGQ